MNDVVKFERAPSNDRICLIPFDKIELSTGRRYLVKDLIPRVGLTVVWGEPKSGKSFWTFDCVMHVALGWEYRGRRVQQGPVVYCAFEGASGFEARIEAFRLERLDGHDGHVPFYLQPVTLNLVREHEALIKVVRNTLGDKPAVVVLDTLNRSMPGSESSDADMTAYIQAASAIREAFDCAVVIVHHCGHDKNRMRGHSALMGALDAEIAVKRESDGSFIASVEAMKDGPTGAQIRCRLAPLTVGQDEDKDEITSCVVNPCEAPTARLEPKLTANQKTMFALLHDAGSRGLLTEEWDAKAKEAGIGERRRADRTDARTSLKAKGLVREFANRWTVNHGT
jgi:hypothetical protein